MSRCPASCVPVAQLRPLPPDGHGGGSHSVVRGLLCGTEPATTRTVT